MPATKSSHAFCLDTGHPEKVLRVGQVVGKLSELCVQLGLYKNILASPACKYSLNTGLAVYRTSCRCLRALPEVAIDWRCTFWVFVFIMT